VDVVGDVVVTLIVVTGFNVEVEQDVVVVNVVVVVVVSEVVVTGRVDVSLIDVEVAVSVAVFE
jgi:hypothetical protein